MEPQLVPVVPGWFIRLFVDGVVENQTASLHRPYRRSRSCGAPLMAGDVLHAAVNTCVDAAFNIHVHSIGDAATTGTLDGLESVRDRSAARNLRHQICHLQLIRRSDIARFAELGVIANVQALWACRDEQNVNLCAPLLGSERFNAQYPFGDLHRAGARPAFGSDWRVSTPNPLPQMEVAVTRRLPADTNTAPLGVGQELDLTTCLLGFTRWAAYAAGVDDRTGVLGVGRSADIVLLNQDPYRIPPRELTSVNVDATIFRGRIVYER